MPRKARIGDVVEIKTSRGLVYAQHTHSVPKWGALICVFQGAHDRRPADLAAVVQGPAQFLTFFPLTAAINRRLVEVVANLPVPPERQRFPRFREAGFIDRSGKVLDWWLWDGKSGKQVGPLTDELRQLPILEVLNATALVERIERAWTPARDRLG
jgi:hypothetical protein